MCTGGGSTLMSSLFCKFDVLGVAVVDSTSSASASVLCFDGWSKSWDLGDVDVHPTCFSHKHKGSNFDAAFHKAKPPRYQQQLRKGLVNHQTQRWTGMRSTCCILKFERKKGELPVRRRTSVLIWPGTISLRLLFSNFPPTTTLSLIHFKWLSF